MTSQRLLAVGRWLHVRTENVAVLLIGTMFLCFLLQIAFRYVLNRPLGWTEEVTVLCWVWTVLWGASFIVHDRDEIRFDILSSAVSPPIRRAFTVAAGIALIVLLLISLPATWRYVAFMKREHSAYLHIPFSYLYSIYVLFAVACIIKHGLIVWRAIRGIEPEPLAPDSAVQGEQQ